MHVTECIVHSSTDDDMIEAFSDLEKFINEPSDLPLLVRAALIHYQFETIHPFNRCKRTSRPTAQYAFSAGEPASPKRSSSGQPPWVRLEEAMPPSCNVCMKRATIWLGIRFYLDSIVEAVETFDPFSRDLDAPCNPLPLPTNRPRTPSDTSSAPTPLSRQESDLPF